MIDPHDVPRFAGVTTFMGVSHRRDLDGVDASTAFLGLPFDDATTYRPCARFGPRSVRDAPTLLKPYNPETGTDLSAYGIVDNDDVPVVPGYTDDTLAAIEERVSYVLDHGIMPVVAGGDHSTTLLVLRATAAEHSPVSFVQFDAHSGLWAESFGRQHNHGTTVHTAIEEGLIHPETSIRTATAVASTEPTTLT